MKALVERKMEPQRKEYDLTGIGREDTELLRIYYYRGNSVEA